MVIRNVLVIPWINDQCGVWITDLEHSFNQEVVPVILVSIQTIHLYPMPIPIFGNVHQRVVVDSESIEISAEMNEILSRRSELDNSGRGRKHIDAIDDAFGRVNDLRRLGKCAESDDYTEKY